MTSVLRLLGVSVPFAVACGPAAPANAPSSNEPPPPSTAGSSPADATAPAGAHGRTSPASGAAPAAETPAASLAEGQTCGTRGVRGDCAAGLYCAYTTSCGETDSGGVCTKRPEMCTKQYQPVCGCDGKTHGNPCAAASAGVSVRAKGECPPGT